MGKRKGGFLEGAVAGGVKLLLTMPLDTVKVTMQLHRRSGGGGGDDPRFLTMYGTTRAIIEAEGVVGLYLGLSASLMNQVHPIRSLLAFSSS